MPAPDGKPWPSRWDARLVSEAHAALVGVTIGLSDLEDAQQEYETSPDSPPVELVLDAVRDARKRITALDEHLKNARRLVSMAESSAIEKDGERRSSPSRPKEA